MLLAPWPCSGLIRPWWENVSSKQVDDKKQVDEHAISKSNSLTEYERGRLRECGSRWIKVNLCINTRQLFTCGFRGEGALHDPHVLRVARVPSSPQISYLTTITTVHGWTKTQKSPRSAPQISRADACGWCDTATEAQTSYSQALSTSVLSYSRHFTPSKPSCLGIDFVVCRAGLITAVLHGRRL